MSVVGGIPQQWAEDFYMRRRYEYYVMHRPTMSDQEFDQMEKFFRGLFPDSHILHQVGSDKLDSYPPYIREARRPMADERRFLDGSNETTCTAEVLC